MSGADLETGVESCSQANDKAIRARPIQATNGCAFLRPRSTLPNIDRDLSPDISYPLGRKPSSPFEANHLRCVLGRFYDYSLDRILRSVEEAGLTQLLPEK